MPRFLFICCLLFAASTAFSQNVYHLKGQVTDSENGKPVPFVNILLNGYYYGTSTNLEGRFELKIRPDQVQKNNHLKISCIGYENQLIALQTINFEHYQQIQLKRSSNALGEFVVKGTKLRKKEENQAKKLVQSAIDRIPKNKAKGHYTADSFYRHYCKEDSSYVRLVEAALSFYQEKSNKSFSQIPEERLNFHLAQLRRSFDFTAFAKLEHPPISLNFLLSNDLMNYEFRNPLRSAFNRLKFTIKDTTQFNNEAVVLVDFISENTEHSTRSYSGMLYITLKDKAFVRADIQEAQTQVTSYDSTYSVVEKKIFYQRIDQHYYPNRVISDVAATHVDLRYTTQPSTRHESHIELMVNNIQQKGDPDGFSREEPKEEQLNNITFDSTFWNDYTVLQATPLEDQIIEDLSQRMELDEQFLRYNQMKKGIRGIIEEPDFLERITATPATFHFVVFWAGWAPPNYYELIGSTTTRRLIKKGIVQVHLVSLDQATEQWQTNQVIHGLIRPEFHQSQYLIGLEEDLVRKFFKEFIPTTLLLDGEGNLIDAKPKLLSDPAFSSYINSLK